MFKDFTTPFLRNLHGSVYYSYIYILASKYKCLVRKNILANMKIKNKLMNINMKIPNRTRVRDKKNQIYHKSHNFSRYIFLMTLQFTC